MTALPSELVRVDASGATFQVRVTPRARRDEIGPVVDGVLRLKVAAPPVQGQANEAVVALLASALGVPKGAVQIIAGATARRKTIRVTGVSAPALEQLFFNA